MRSEWEKIIIRDICDSVSVTHKLDQDKIVLINTSDVYDGKVTNHIPVKNSNLRGQFKKSFQKDDILYSEIRPKNRRFANIDFNSQDYVASTKLMVLRCRQDKILPQFLFHILKNDAMLDHLQLLAETRSGTFPQITFTELGNIEILLPSLSEQRAIAATLSCLDDKIEINNRINANLEAQAQAIFKSWFVDFEPFRDCEFVDSELGPIPKGWRVGLLSELISVKYGKDHKKLTEGSIPVYGSGGIMRYADKALYTKESVLIPRKGSLNNVIYINEPFWSVDTMFYTEMLKPNIAKYIYFFISNKDLASMNAGSAVPSMTTDILNSIPVIIAPPDIYKQYDNLVSPMFLLKKHCNEENHTLAALRGSLIPKLMSGEIEVPI